MPPSPSWLRNEASIALRLLIIAAAFLLLAWMVMQVRVIAVAAFIAFAQAALLWPLVKRLRQRLPGYAAAILVMVVYVALILWLCWFIVVELASAWPTLLNAVLGGAQEANDWFLERGWSVPPALVDELVSEARSAAATVFSGIGSVAISSLGIVASLVTVMIIATFATLFSLTSGRALLDSALGLVPSAGRQAAGEAFRRAFTAARWWMYASTLTGLVDGTLIGVGLWLLDVPLAITLALATFILGFIPMVGATVAGAAAVMVGLFFGGPSTGAAVLVLVLLVQQIEGNVLSPLLMSRAMHFHPVVTLLLATAGGAAFGVIGVFLAVPITGITAAAVKGWRSVTRADPEAVAADRAGPDGSGTGADPGNDDQALPAVET